MDPRRLDQLDRARKLRARVSILLARGHGAPETVELDQVQREALEASTRVHVVVRSWVDATRYVTISARPDTQDCVTEDRLADAVDRALHRFEAIPTLDSEESAEEQK